MAKPYNPLAPLSPKQQRALAIKYTRAQYGPILSQINQGYARRSQQGAASIAQGTSALAASLAPQAAQTHQIYAEAQSAQSAIDNAIASKLAAAGQAGQADVGGQLASAGLPPSPTNLAQVGAGAGAASFGMGSAALSRLVAEGAARENYASQLPGISRSGGAYRAQDLALQLEHGRQTDVGNLLAKEPGTIAQIQQSISQNEFNKAAANLTYGTNVAKLSETAQYHSGSLKAREDAIAAANARSAASNRISAGRISEQQRHNLATEQARTIANDIAKYRAHHPRSTRAGGGITPTAKTKFYAQGTPAALEHKKGGSSAKETYRFFVNRGMPPRIAADIVGRTYGQWLNPGDKKKLGIR